MLRHAVLTYNTFPTSSSASMLMTCTTYSGTPTSFARWIARAVASPAHGRRGQRGGLGFQGSHFGPHTPVRGVVGFQSFAQLSPPPCEWL